MDDASIIGLFRERDEQAIAEMKRKYGRLCYYVAGNILSQREDMEECVNSAYYEIWNNIPPDDPNDLRSYLCRIVRNIAINRLKYISAEKRNPQFTVPIDEIAETIPSDDDRSVSDEALADAISRFLRTQDEKRRNVFIRRYWFGDSLAQIAEHYGMKEKTVATYLFRTRKKLKAFLQYVAPLTASTPSVPFAAIISGITASAFSQYEGVSFCSVTSMAVTEPSVTVTETVISPRNPLAVPVYVPSLYTGAASAKAAIWTVFVNNAADSAAHKRRLLRCLFFFFF